MIWTQVQCLENCHTSSKEIHISKRKILNDLFNNLKNELPKDDYINFGNLYKGIIATGDMFISKENKKFI